MIKATIILVIGLYSHCVQSGSLVNVRLPFLAPAGVTYINGPTPTGLVASPVAIPARYAQPHFAAPAQYAAPVQYAAQSAFPASAFAAPLLKAAPVPHVPAVADIPVTQYEAHHGFVQKLVDVAKPALKTRKFEVRRPAIQKHFYDIEERIIVRPAGSALVELDQPTSKNQKGADIITPVLPAVAVPAVPVPAVPVAARLALPHQNIFVSSTPSPFSYSTAPGISLAPFQFASQVQQEQHLHPQQQQQPQQEQQQQNNFNPVDNEDNNESVVVEARSNFGQINPQQSQRQEQPQSNPQLETEVRFRSLGSAPPAPRFNLVQSNDEQQPQRQQEQDNYRSNEQRNFNSPQFLRQREQNQQQQNEPQLRNAPQIFQSEQNNDQNQQQDEPQLEQQRFESGQPRQLQRANFEQQPDQNQAGPSPNVIFRNAISEEESLNNQQRLIKLLTENDGVSELDQFDGRKFSFRGDSGLLRARVLQFNQAGPNAKSTDERVNTRRVVLSRPIETVQEIEVVEPITKIHKVAFNEPTIFKTARLGYQRVHTSVPAVPVHPQYTDFHH